MSNPITFTRRFALIAIFLLTGLLFTQGCRRWFHAECRSSYQVNRGKIEVSLVYNCLIQDPDAKGDTSIYTTQTQWDTLWARLAAKYGNGCPKPAIDFTQFDVLTFFQVYNSTYKIIREVTFDDAKKEVVYTITQFKCKSGSGSNSMNENMVVIPKIPAGYKVVWVTEKN